jgi:hypothetical protein
MPTHEEEESFRRDWDRLTLEQQDTYLVAVDKLVDDMKSGLGFRKGLRVKGVQGHPGIFEMTWADDGRATFTFSTSPHPGDTHIIWRRIGTYGILKSP